jgi:hypothetical protein
LAVDRRSKFLALAMAALLQFKVSTTVQVFMFILELVLVNYAESSNGLAQLRL